MKLIPEQIDWYLSQIESTQKKAEDAIKAQQELSQIERYKATAYSDQDCATAAEQTMFEQALYYNGQASGYESALENIELPRPDVNSDVAEIGSYVTVVDTATYTDGGKEKTHVRVLKVLLIEGELGNRNDLDIKCASANGALGKALLGAWPDDVVCFETTRGKSGKMMHSCEVESVDNNFIYQRYPEYYEKGGFDLSSRQR